MISDVKIIQITVSCLQQISIIFIYWRPVRQQILQPYPIESQCQSIHIPLRKQIHIITVPADPDIITTVVIIVTEPIAVRTIDIDPSFGKHQLISRQKQQVSLIQQIMEKIE